MNNQMPMAVWRAGMDKIEAAARGCGYAASLGQRKRVAHIPTAEAAKRLDTWTRAGEITP